MLAQLTLQEEKDKYGEIAPKAFPAQVAKPVFISIDPRPKYLPHSSGPRKAGVQQKANEDPGNKIQTEYGYGGNICR